MRIDTVAGHPSCQSKCIKMLLNHEDATIKRVCDLASTLVYSGLSHVASVGGRGGSTSSGMHLNHSAQILLVKLWVISVRTE